MKKSFFGFSAKVAMAVLAVCSFVLTGCYEKDVQPKTPTKYYVSASALDSETGSVVTKATITIVAGSKTIAQESDGSIAQTEFDYAPVLTVSATAEGYFPTQREVKIEKLHDFLQVSYTDASIAMIKMPETPQQPDVPEVPEVELGEPELVSKAAGEVKSLFNINFGEVCVDGKGLVEVYAHYAFDEHANHSNYHANFNPTHVNHVNHVNMTSNPYFVEDSLYVGFASADAVMERKDVKAEAILALNANYVGATYKDFSKNGFVKLAAILNENGEMNLAGYCICRHFTLYSLPFEIDGVEHSVLALKADATYITPIGFDIHDNHDNHDNHTNCDSHGICGLPHHKHTHGDFHGGATAWGGGSNVEGE